MRTSLGVEEEVGERVVQRKGAKGAEDAKGFAVRMKHSVHAFTLCQRYSFAPIAFFAPLR
jgi:hypothetical protein